MVGGKRRYNVRFAPKRIKKIMQKDTEVGRVAQAVPVMICAKQVKSAKALEMFIKSLLTKTRMMMTQSKRSAVLSIALIKQCIDSENLFHFLEELAEHASSLSQEDARTMSMWSLYRTKRPELCVKNQIEVGEKAPKPSLSSLDNDASSSDMESELYICL